MAGTISAPRLWFAKDNASRAVRSTYRWRPESPFLKDLRHSFAGFKAVSDIVAFKVSCRKLVRVHVPMTEVLVVK